MLINYSCVPWRDALNTAMSLLRRRYTRKHPILEQMKLWISYAVDYAILSDLVARTHNVSKAIHYQVTTELGRSFEGFRASWRSESHIQRLPNLLEVNFFALLIVTQSRRLQTARVQ